VAAMLGHRDGGTLALQVYGHVIADHLKSKVANLKMVA
jgi:site-specific recombinase XerD